MFLRGTALLEYEYSKNVLNIETKSEFENACTEKSFAILAESGRCFLSYNTKIVILIFDKEVDLNIIIYTVRVELNIILQ